LLGTALEGARYNAETRWPAGFVPAGAHDVTCHPARRDRDACRAFTYRVGRARPGTLRLWTIQPFAVWERLRRCQALYVDSVLSDQDFLTQYDWMREQMARRLQDYQGHSPWWAWFRPKPDLRRWHACCAAAGSRGVRLELAVPAERVLLSNEATWLCVLNGWYLGRTRAEYEAWNREIERESLDDSAGRLPEPWAARVVASWEHIFDIEALAAGDEWSDAVQATFERLELADVVAVTEFTAREHGRL
jgi:Domain of unknown function (DUF3841)